MYRQRVQSQSTWWSWFTRPLGVSWLSGRRHRQDLARLQKEVAQNPGEARCLRQLGDALVRAGDLRGAKKVFEDAGRMHLRAAHPPRAIAMLSKAAELDRRDWQLRGWIGDLYVDAGRRREAALMFLEAAELAHHQDKLVECEVYQARAEHLLPSRPIMPGRRNDSVLPPESSIVVSEELIFDDPVILPPAPRGTSTELALDAESLLLGNRFTEEETAACSPSEIESIRASAFSMPVSSDTAHN